MLTHMHAFYSSEKRQLRLYEATHRSLPYHCNNNNDYFLWTMTTSTVSVLFFLLWCIGQKVPASRWHISPPRNAFFSLFPPPSVSKSVVSVWVLRLCHAAVPSHSSLVSSGAVWKRHSHREKERERRERETSRAGDPVRSLPRWCHGNGGGLDAGRCMIILSSKHINTTWLMFIGCLS